MSYTNTQLHPEENNIIPGSILGHFSYLLLPPWGEPPDSAPFFGTPGRERDTTPRGGDKRAPLLTPAQGRVPPTATISGRYNPRLAKEPHSNTRPAT